MIEIVYSKDYSIGLLDGKKIFSGFIMPNERAELSFIRQYNGSKLVSRLNVVTWKKDKKDKNR